MKIKVKWLYPARFLPNVILTVFLIALLLVVGCSAGDHPLIPGSSDADSAKDVGLDSISSGIEPGTGAGIVNGKSIYMPNEVMVVLIDTAQSSHGSDVFSPLPLKIIQTINSHWATIYRLAITDGSSVEQMVSKLKQDPNVRIAEPNYILNFLEAPYNPNDPMWNPSDPGNDPRNEMWAQWGPAKLGASILWNESKGANDVVVAVIDTGVRRTHEDLINNLWINEDEVQTNGIDDDGNGYIDDWWGWNCFEGNNNPFDLNGSNYYHGTGCAGVIVATQDNGKGISGIAPGCKVMAIRADMNDGPTCEATVCEALNYAKDNGADIISMSFGVIYATEILDLQCADIWDNGNGPIMLASAGNDNNTNVLAPARYDSVIAVGATIPWSYGGAPVDEGRIQPGWNGWWWGSTYGPKLHIMGFGERTYSTYGSGDDQYWDGVNHWFFNGTSCACPTSAGVMALVMSFHPGHTGQWYWDRIEQTSDDLDVPGFDNQTGWGRVNAFRAVRGLDYFDSIDVLGFVTIQLQKPAENTITQYESIHDVSASNPYCDTVDLYRIIPATTGPLMISLDIFTWGEDLDMALYSDPMMLNMIDSSTGPNHADSSFEQIIVNGVAGTRYFLKVYSPALGNSTTYGLTVEKM
jgi:subtilisin family serine protease